MKKKEQALTKELQQFQRWETAVQHSFETSSSLFSFLWRFRTDPALGLKPFRAVEPVEDRMAKNIMAASKRHKAHLRAFLKPGHIYLIPDAEVTFSSAQRFKQGYARRVLILNVHDNQVLMIPFSTKIERMNRQTDILFDSQYRGERLDPNGLPTVENLPLSLFPHKTALVVSAAQPMTSEAFIEGALIPVGSVDPALLSVARKKLKNL